MQESLPPKTRRMSEATRTNQAAAALLRPYNQRLGEWQAVSVKISTALQRERDADAVETLRSTAKELLNVVKDDWQHFEAILPKQPERVARHGRVQDTRRSFQMVVARLAGLLASS